MVNAIGIIYRPTWLICCGALLLTASCKKEKPPVACFVVETQDIKVNDEVVFDASCSEGADSFEWYATDQAGSVKISTYERFKHRFSTGGLKEIKLVAINKGGTHETTQSITIADSVSFAILPGPGSEFPLRISMPFNCPMRFLIMNNGNPSSSFSYTVADNGALGGHLHRYGRSLILENVTSGDVKRTVQKYFGASCTHSK